MNRRTRDNQRNIPLFKRSVDVIRDIVVGAEGVKAWANPFDSSFGFLYDQRPDTELMRSINYCLESDEKFERWANTPKFCDATGQMTFAEMQRQSISENVLTGDVILVETASHPKSPVPLAYKMIEREQLDCSRDRPATKDQNAIVNGFEIDQMGREVGCWILDDHPYDDSFRSGTSQFIKATRYIHVWRSFRPSQTIGTTWLHAMATVLMDRENLINAELQTALKQALMCLIYKTDFESEEGLGFTQDVDERGRPIVTFDNYTQAIEIGKDEEVKLVETTRPNSEMDKFFKLTDHDAAAAAGLSYYSLTGRFSETNYTGFRGASNLEAACMAVVQNWFSWRMVCPVRQRWNELAAALGHLKTVSPVDFAKEKTRFQTFDFVGPGRFLIEPDGELKADLAFVRSNIRSHRRICAKHGEHWLKVYRDRSLEQRIEAMLNIRSDYSNQGMVPVDSASQPRNVDNTEQQREQQ